MIRRTLEALGPPASQAGGTQWLVNQELTPGALGMLMVQTVAKGATLPAHHLLSAEAVTFVLSGKGDCPSGSKVLFPLMGVWPVCKPVINDDLAGPHTVLPL